MQPGWEFHVNACGRTWYSLAGTRQVQLWRPEVHEEEVVDEEEEDPEAVALRDAAAAAAALADVIAYLKARQAEVVASVTALQGKADALTKALKTKKGDALKAGQAQQQALEKEIKASNQDLATIKSQIADVQKKLPAPVKSAGTLTQGKGDASSGAKKAVTAVASGKPLSRANTVASSKSLAPLAAAKKPSAVVKPAPISRSSTITSVSSTSVSGSVSTSGSQKQASKTAPPPVPEIKEFGRAIETLDSKLLIISDEVCLDIHDQMWAPIKKLSFYPVAEKLPAHPAASAAQADVKRSVPSSSASTSVSTPAKTAANTPVKASATPLSRSGSSSVSGSATPLSSARK